MANPGAESQKPRKRTTTAHKLANLKFKTNAELKDLSEKIEKEIVQARDWPPPEMVCQEIKRDALAMGTRALKLITALEKAETRMIALDKEVNKLKAQPRGADASQVAHLSMENKLLKEQLQTLSGQAEDGKSLKDENVDLRLKLEELEAELNRLLIESADAQEFREENEDLRRENEELRSKIEKISGAPKTSESGRLLLNLWDMADVDEEDSDDDPKVASLRGRVRRLSEEVDRSKKKITSLKEQNENLSSKVMELAEAAALRAESAMEEINSLREERTMLEKELEKRHSRIEMQQSDRESEFESLRSESEYLRERVRELEAGQGSNADDLLSLAEAVAETEEIRAQYGPLVESLVDPGSGTEAEIKLRDAVTGLIDRCEALERQKIQAVTELEERKRVGAEADEEGEDLEGIIAALKMHIGDLERELDEKDEEIESIRAQTGG
jgi:hypothetical protein